MTTHNPAQMNAFKLSVKSIGGKLYRVNNFIPSILNKSNNTNIDTKALHVREFRLVNLAKKMANVLSDDDMTSESEISKNLSFVEEDEEQPINDIEDFKFIENTIDIDSLMLLANEKDISGMVASKSKGKPETQKVKWTHFLAIPLHANKEFIEKYEYLKKRIIEENFADIDDSLFQQPERLHMTICLFKADNNAMLKTIDSIMAECESSVKKILDNNPLYIDFDQIEVMGTETRSRVLYTRPHLSDSEKLKDIIDIYVSKFIENNILTTDMIKLSHIFFNEITERYENQKPHVTLMNSTFLIRENIKNNENKDSKEIFKNSHFNGVRIIKRMKNFSFGAHKIENIVLNEMKIDYNTDSYKIYKSYKI